MGRLPQEVNNDKLAIVISDKDCPTARVMDGVHRQLTLWTRTGSETKRKFFKYKIRKALPRSRPPAARPAIAPRVSARQPVAASKPSLRRRVQDGGVSLPDAKAAGRPTRPARPKPDPAAVAAAKEARAKAAQAAAESREAKRQPARAEQEDTEDEEYSDEDDTAPGGAVTDEQDPEV
jgi:pyruvate/2-oxoglutarate dehydrogenase complex dihydrolipoamide acyltransferase (E2) component